MSDGTTVEDKITSLESDGTDFTGYAKQEDLATVATSGSYNENLQYRLLLRNLQRQVIYLC